MAMADDDDNGPPDEETFEDAMRKEEERKWSTDMSVWRNPWHLPPNLANF
ncbi:unnamed protein product [Arabis nemorensis]|uniref:Uncharacterized protein n=1 Tax=Arabis nemorensis TaxID=586526 RepID=A0A565ARW6_9BRAS|nr:unnamed protein product [Arabis nemorensis]